MQDASGKHLSELKFIENELRNHMIQPHLSNSGLMCSWKPPLLGSWVWFCMLWLFFHH